MDFHFAFFALSLAITIVSAALVIVFAIATTYGISESKYKRDRAAQRRYTVRLIASTSISGFIMFVGIFFTALLA